MTNQSHSGSGDNVAGNKKVNNYVSVNTIWMGVGVLLLGLAIWLLPKLLPDPVPLTGYIVSNADVPMDKVKVTVVPDGDREPVIGYTDENGFFRLEKVDVEDIASFSIAAQFNERKTERAFSGITPDSLPLTVQMPAGIPPFKVTYTVLEGYAIDFFLEGKTDKKIFGSLFSGGRTYILPNSITYQALQDLREKYGRKVELYEGTGNAWVREISPDGRIVFEQALPGKQERTGDFFDRMFIPPKEENKRAELLAMGDWVAQENPEQARADMELLLREQYNWEETREGRLDELWVALDKRWTEAYGSNWAYELGFVDYEKRLGENPEAFFRLLTDGKFYSRTAKATLEFYREITRPFLPPDFLRFRYILDCVQPRVLLSVPDLQVRIAIIENSTANPINLDSFYLRENPVLRLRTPDGEAETLDARPVQARKLFPNHTLGAGEQLVIPVALEFVYRKDIRVDDSADDTYLYGPAIHLEEILVGIEKYPVREMNPDVFAFVDGYKTMASCPFVYTRRESGAPWLLEDHILYGRSRAERQGFDTLQLQRFNGELQLREIDPETSFIDLVEVMFQPQDGGEARILRADLTELSRHDEVQLIMNQGDERTLHFPDYDPTAEGIYSVVAYGWYEPYVYE